MELSPFTSSDLFQFAANLSRAQAAAIRDPLQPQPRAEVRSRLPFDRLPKADQLEAIELAAEAQPEYQAAVGEALNESPDSELFLQKLVDRRVPDEELGRLARLMLVDYLERVALFRGDDLTEFL